MDGGLNLAFVKTALGDFQPGKDKSQRQHLAPLPKISSSREKELNDVYCQVQNEIKQIKDDVLNDLANGGAVDYEKIKTLFENAELEIQEKKNHILHDFNTKAATVSTPSLIKENAQKRQIMSVGITGVERVSVPKLDGDVSKKHAKRNQSAPISSTQKNLDYEKLKNIINPARKEARSLLNKHYGIPTLCEDLDRKSANRSVRSHMKPITGSTINHPHYVDSLTNPRLTPPPPTSDDARKGILNLIQRKMIPAAASLTIVPSPIKHQQVVLHEPSNKKLSKQDFRSQYNLALVKFDESTLDRAIDRNIDIPVAQAPNASTVNFHNTMLTLEEEEEGLQSSEFLTDPDSKLSMLRTLLPASCTTTSRPSHKFIIQDGTTLANSQDFIHFKQYYCLSWESISKLLLRIEKLMTDFSVPIAFIDGDRLADMSLYFEIGPTPTMKDLLMCVLNSDDAEKIICIPGRRFLAVDGEDMAAIRIQALWRGYHQKNTYQTNRRKKWAAGLIALTWIMKCKITYIRRHMKQKNAEYLEKFHIRMKVFKDRWPKIKNSKRVIIHIPSLGYSINIRRSLHEIPSLQNCQIGRICDIRDPNVEVIYICPLEMDSELHEYYRRLVEIMSSVAGEDFQNVSSRLKMLTPECLLKFVPHNFCLTSLLKYSEKLIQRIKCLIKGKEAYIVSGFMHDDDLCVADKLDLPILGCEPDIAHLYSLKSGVHRIFESAGVATPPGEHDVYTKQQFDESLSKLVTQNLHIKRWLFKIDNNFDGRGTAYCDVTPYLQCYGHAVKEADRYGRKWRERWAHENIYNRILNELPQILESHAATVDKSVYRNWHEFMIAFLCEGGIIEACPPTDSVTGITGNVLIEPDGGIQILSVADQIHSTSPYKCWGHSLPQSSFDVPIMNETILTISEACRSRGIIGYLSIDFVTFIDPKTDGQELWAVGMNIGYNKTNGMIQLMTFLTDANLDVGKNTLEVVIHKTPKLQAPYVSKYRRANPVKERLTEKRQRVAVVSPDLIHSNLNNIVYSVFFQICKAHGIGYDDKMKIGTTFTLVNHVKRELLGMITVAENLHDAVSTFALNLAVIHNDISSTNMSGRNNFQGAIDDLKSILEALRINLELNQNQYPTMDPNDRRLTNSARNAHHSSDDEDDYCRAKSVNHGHTLISERSLEDLSRDLVTRTTDGCRPSPASL